MENRPELELLLDWRDPEQPGRAGRAAAISVIFHVLLVLGLPLIPATRQVYQAPEVRALDFRKPTPLVAPPPSLIQERLTQIAPNQGKIGKEFDLASLLPKPAVENSKAGQDRPAPPPAPKPQPQFSPPPAPPPAAPKAIEPPKIEMTPQPVDIAKAQGIPQGIPPPPPKVETAEKPKIAFERVGSPAGNSPRGADSPKLELPKPSIEAIGQTLARGGAGGGLIVGDMGDTGSGIADIFRQSPSPGRTGSTLELLSDPEGVDFKPYLVQILAAVKRNWLAVIPESVRLGRRGRTVIQFSIGRNGEILKLVIAGPSGAEALDRAAVAGISASYPLPPLPAQFRGSEVRLQFVFSYNMPVR